MSSAFFIPTSNEDVVLRHLTVEDSTPYFEAIERSKDHLSRMGYLTAVNNETMDKVVQNITNPKNSKRTSMGIWDTTKFIGEVSLTPREVPYSLPEVESGVWVDTQFRGNGYERLALCALSKFVKPKFPYIYSEVYQDDEYSVEVLLRSCYKFDSLVNKKARWARYVYIPALLDDTDYLARYYSTG